MAVERVELFEWLHVVALALGRKRVSPQAAAIAMFVGMGSRGTTGEGATVDVARLAVELDLSERQAWRHFKTLCEAGWFEQTSLPTRGHKGEPGRRARYRLTYPRSVMSDENRVTLPRAETSHDDGRDTESSDTSTPNRLTLSPESCDTAERENGTVLPSYGSPTDGTPTGSSSASATGARLRMVAGTEPMVVDQ